MNKSKILKRILAVSVACTTILAAGCTSKSVSSGNSGTGSAASAGGTITVNFWSAPEKTNYDFWNKYATKFNATNPQLNGKTIKVVVQQMPGQPTSEAGIQNAIVTGSVPAASEGISRSFAATLANSSAVYNLSNEDWYKAIVTERKLDSIMSQWAIGSDEYVIPIYINPISYCWNSKALKQLGVTKVPETVDEFNQLLQTYNQKKSALNSKGITHFMYRYELTRSDNWWERWFDFESQYDAFSQGKKLVDGDKLTMDKTVAKQVFDLYGEMGNSLLTGQIDKLWQKKTVPVVVGMGEPWDITPNKAAGKVYGLDGDYVYGPMLVQKAGDTAYTFADSKGLVFYKNKNVSDEQHNGAIEFVKYIFTGAGKDTFDIDWLNTASMLPVRGDLNTNTELASFFDKNPEWKAVSAYVANSIPCMANEKMGDILTALGAKGLIPYVNEKVSKTGIGSAPDSTSYVNAAYDAMKAAGKLQ